MDNRTDNCHGSFCDKIALQVVVEEIVGGRKEKTTLPFTQMAGESKSTLHVRTRKDRR
jgi:hypothetical protein